MAGKLVLRARQGLYWFADGSDTTSVSNGTKVIDASNGQVSGTVVPGDITLTDTHIFVGNGSGVAADVAMSGDATMADTGAITVASANAAFNIGTNGTFSKEINHTVTVTTSTTTNAAGGNLTCTAGAGNGTGAGGNISVVAGASGGGATGNGGIAALTGGAAASTNGNGGDAVVTPGAKTGSGLAGQLYLRSNPFFKMGAPVAKTISTTIMAADMLNGLITGAQGAGAGATYTLDTGANLAAALPTVQTGDCFEFMVINISTNALEDITMAGSTGITYVGATLINANDVATETSAATFLVRCTGAGTFTCYRIS